LLNQPWFPLFITRLRLPLHTLQIGLFRDNDRILFNFLVFYLNTIIWILSFPTVSSLPLLPIRVMKSKHILVFLSSQNFVWLSWHNLLLLLWKVNYGLALQVHWVFMSNITTALFRFLQSAEHLTELLGFHYFRPSSFILYSKSWCEGLDYLFSTFLLHRVILDFLACQNIISKGIVFLLLELNLRPWNYQWSVLFNRFQEVFPRVSLNTRAD
jgi:hypothetical protein